MISHQSISISIFSDNGTTHEYYDICSSRIDGNTSLAELLDDVSDLLVGVLLLDDLPELLHGPPHVLLLLLRHLSDVNLLLLDAPLPHLVKLQPTHFTNQTLRVRLKLGAIHLHL